MDKMLFDTYCHHNVSESHTDGCFSVFWPDAWCVSLTRSVVDVETLSSRMFVIYTHKEPHVFMILWCWDTAGPLEANKNLIGPKRAPVHCLKTHLLFWRSYTVLQSWNLKILKAWFVFLPLQFNFLCNLKILQNKS